MKPDPANPKAPPSQPSGRGHRHRPPRQVAFSLPEVTIAIGIVAAVVLPTLALLATGSRMARVSADQDLAARIARDAASRVRPAAEGGGFEFVPGGGGAPVALPSPGGASGASWYAAFSPEGEYLREVAPGEYRSGLSPESRALHLLALSLGRVEPSAHLPRGEASLYHLELSVESPAAAGLRNRDKLVFSTRLAGP